MDCCIACQSTRFEFFCEAFDRLQIQPDTRYRIIRCNECGLGWTEPSPSVEELPGYYPAAYLGDTRSVIEEYLSGRLQGTASWRMEEEKVRLVERFLPGGRILDVGCAEGKFLWALSPQKWERQGVEFDKDVVRVANQMVPGVKLHDAPLETAALEPGSFDVITFWHVLEHVPDPSATLESAYRLLGENGYLFVSSPNLESYQARWLREHWYAFSDVPRHLFHFSPRALELLFRRASCRPVDTLFFSKKVNFHCWKHSWRSWWNQKSGSLLPYYLTKPLLHLLPSIEQLTRQYSIMTCIGKKVSS